MKFADQLVGRAADQRRGDVIAEAEDEGQQAAGHDPGHHLRQIDAPEGGERPCAERIGGPHLRRRDRPHDAVDRQQRERQLDMRHGDDQAGARVHQVEALVGDVQREQQIVQNPEFLQTAPSRLPCAPGWRSRMAAAPA